MQARTPCIRIQGAGPYIRYWPYPLSTYMYRPRSWFPLKGLQAGIWPVLAIPAQGLSPRVIHRCSSYPYVYSLTVSRVHRTWAASVRTAHIRWLRRYQHLPPVILYTSNPPSTASIPGMQYPGYHTSTTTGLSYPRPASAISMSMPL